MLLFVQNDIAYYAANGVEMFKDKGCRVKGLATLYPETIQVLLLINLGLLRWIKSKANVLL